MVSFLEKRYLLVTLQIFWIDKKYNTDEYPFAKLLLHYSPKYINRYGRYLPEQICLLLLSGWLIHVGKVTWDFENLH